MLFLPEFSSDSQAVCYIFSKNFQLFLRFIKNFFSPRFYPIDFILWHYDRYVLRFIGMTLLEILSCSSYSGFSGSLSVDRCRFNDVHVG